MPQSITFHPLAEAWPLISGKDWDEFLESIARTKGCASNPIIVRKLPDGSLQGLDGRNRLRACIELGFEPTFVTVQVKDEDVAAFVAMQNMHRRHLSQLPRANLARKLKAAGYSIREIAQATKTSPATISRDLKETEKPPPADPEMCARCARVGRVKDCPACKGIRLRKLREETERDIGDEPRRRRPPLKAGEVDLDWIAVHVAIGTLARAADKFADYHNIKGGALHNEVIGQLEGFRVKLGHWYETVTQRKPPKR
jgi:hypothetical protein